MGVDIKKLENILGSTFWVELSSSEKKPVASLIYPHGTVNTPKYDFVLVLLRLWRAKHDVGFVMGLW